MITRAAASRYLQARLARVVGHRVPPAVRTWPSARAIVASADADFLIALSAFEAEPTEATTEAVREGFYAVLAAWDRALLAFERSAGR